LNFWKKVFVPDMAPEPENLMHILDWGKQPALCPTTL
jgi:hypothetical protein